jgi:hypothetical protein
MGLLLYGLWLYGLMLAQASLPKPLLCAIVASGVMAAEPLMELFILA